MTLKKFDSEGNIEVVGDRVVVDGASMEVPTLQTSPEERYAGTWSPGNNHPQIPADEDGPYAGIIRYMPIPENQIER